MKRQERPLAQWALLLAAWLAASPALAARTVPLVVDHIGTEDGLSQGTVMDVLQDRQGFLWFATENGLDRYDGYEIVRYSRDRTDPESLSSDYIWQIAEDDNGDLWLATDGGGLARWNRETDTFTNFRHDPDDPTTIASNAVRAVAIADDGAIWAGTRGGGLNRLDPRTGQFTHFRHDPADDSSLSHDSVVALHEDRQGRLWAGTESGLNRFLPAAGTFVRHYHDADIADSLSGDTVMSLYEDSVGSLWVGTLRNGANRYDFATGTFQRYEHDPEDPASLSNGHVRDFLEDDRGRLWIATENGLNLLHRSSGEFSRYYGDSHDRHNLDDSYVMSLFQDVGGVIWMGTRAAGVAYWNPRSWSLGHYKDDWLAGATVMAFAEMGDGSVWVGTAGAGLANVHLGTGRTYRLGEQAALDDERVMSLLRARDGALWIGTLAGGLSRYDPVTEELTTYRADGDDPASIGADGIMALYEDRQGNVWAGTFGGGLNLFDARTGSFVRFADKDETGPPLANARVTAIVEDSEGFIWFGTDGAGLNRLNRTDRTIRRFFHDPSAATGLSADSIYALHIDEDGALWIGTAGGGLDRAVRSSGDTSVYDFLNYSRRHGLSSSVIYGIQPDGRGNLWLSGNDGLMRLDRSTGEVVQYHRNHGLQSEEFNFGAHHRGKSGRLYFGGNNGFNSFYPAGIETGRMPPHLALTGVEVLNAPARLDRPYPLVDQVPLGYKDDVVTFEFAALDFVAPARNRYEYRLEGFDRGWKELVGRPRVTYTNLDGGHYVFRVRAANSDGIWNDEGLSIDVVVQSPPWATTWAYALYAMSLVLFAWLAFRWHATRLQREAANSRRLEAMVQERTAALEASNEHLQAATRAKSDFLAKMSHEIRTPMNGVLGMTELLQSTDLNEKQHRFARTIRQSAESLLQIINDILDFSKIEAGKLELARQEFDFNELVDDTAEMLSGQAASKDLRLVASTAPGLGSLLVGDSVRIRQILVNLIGNAVKFTHAGDIVVVCTLEEDTESGVQLGVEVRDTGIGLRPEATERIFDSFSQAGESPAHTANGTGLGLSICKQLVEMMHGEIGVDSTPGEGSTFWFTLRLDKAADTTRPAFVPRSLDGTRVLAFTRHAPTRDALERLLVSWQAETDTVTSVEALAQALRGDEGRRRALDAIILDGDDEHVAQALDVLAHSGDCGSATPSVILLEPTRGENDARNTWPPLVDVVLAKPLRRATLNDSLLALAPRSNHAVSTRAQPSATEVPADRIAARVLLVEDNSVNQMVAEGMLTSLGCDVEIACNGAAAVERVALGGIDIVLMDCLMPVMDGFEAAGGIRELEGNGRRVPIIALTANAISGDRQRCIDAGMDDYLSKPLTLDALHAALERWLPSHGAERRDDGVVSTELDVPAHSDC